MALDYQKLVEQNVSTLHQLRKECATEDYPEEVLFRLFLDLYSITEIWESTYYQLKKGGVEGTYNQLYGRLLFHYQIRRSELEGIHRESYYSGTQIGNISPIHFHKFLAGAKKGSNKCIEEIEYAFVARRPIRDFFIDFLTYILLGFYAEEAYEKLIQNFSFPSNHWGKFNDLFECFAATTLAEISGVENISGKKLTGSLYVIVST